MPAVRTIIALLLMAYAPASVQESEPDLYLAFDAENWRLTATDASEGTGNLAELKYHTETPGKYTTHWKRK